MNFWEEYSAIGSDREKLDFMVATIDDLIRDEKFEDVDNIIKSADTNNLRIIDMVGLLSYTLWGHPIMEAVFAGAFNRHNYPSRPAFFAACKERAIAERGEGETEQLLDGLE
jgi:hypothetical protein